jgi:hypothetical protein
VGSEAEAVVATDADTRDRERTADGLADDVLAAFPRFAFFEAPNTEHIPRTPCELDARQKSNDICLIAGLADAIILLRATRTQYSDSAGGCNTDRVRHPMELTHRMTNARFDALASKTRSCRGGQQRHTNRDGIAFRIVRVVWLTAQFVRRESVTIAEYRRRFGVSLRSFRRDLALLRQAGFYVETTAAGNYRMLSFVLDSDAP